VARWRARLATRRRLGGRSRSRRRRTASTGWPDRAGPGRRRGRCARDAQAGKRVPTRRRDSRRCGPAGQGDGGASWRAAALPHRNHRDHGDRDAQRQACARRDSGVGEPLVKGGLAIRGCEDESGSARRAASSSLAFIGDQDPTVLGDGAAPRGYEGGSGSLGRSPLAGARLATSRTPPPRLAGPAWLCRGSVRLLLLAIQRSHRGGRELDVP
jgi:hypothetical protein